MPDYNIYIHAVGTSNSLEENPTVPWSQRQNAGGTFNTSPGAQSGHSLVAANSIARGIGYAQNPDSIINSTSSASLGSAAKVVPWIAVAVAVVKFGEQVANNAVDFIALETGDYRSKFWLENKKLAFQAVVHPVSSVINAIKISREWAQENQKLRQERDLLGDSVINSYTRRGV